MGNEPKALVGDCVGELHTLALKLGDCLFDIVAIERNVSNAGGFAVVAILRCCGMHAHVGFG